MNVSTCADTKEEATLKVKEYLNAFGWHLLSVERADVVDKSYACGDEVAEMVERTRANPNAIIPGTFHAYKAN